MAAGILTARDRAMVVGTMFHHQNIAGGPVFGITHGTLDCYSACCSAPNRVRREADGVWPGRDLAVLGWHLGGVIG